MTAEYKKEHTFSPSVASFTTEHRSRLPFPILTEFTDVGIRRFFIRLEVWFSTQGINSIKNDRKRDEEQFIALVTNMNDHLFDQVQAIVSNPPVNDKYKHLKSAIMAIFEESSSTAGLERSSHGIDLRENSPHENFCAVNVSHNLLYDRVISLEKSVEKLTSRINKIETQLNQRQRSHKHIRRLIYIFIFVILYLFLFPLTLEKAEYL